MGGVFEGFQTLDTIVLVRVAWLCVVSFVVGYASVLAVHAGGVWG